MTEKTDIAMLREQAETAKVCGGMFAISGEQALSLLDQLEAERHKGDLWFGKVADLEAALKTERQRADEYRQKWTDAVSDSCDRIQELRAELAVLKGEQLPKDWQLVPKKPTPKMRLQMHTVGDVTCYECGADRTYDCTENIDYSWDDMLAAAPSLSKDGE